MTIMIYGSSKLTVMWRWEDTLFQSTIVESQIPMDREYTAEEIGFDFYFHVIEIDELTVRPVPETEYKDYFSIEV